jgi:hypothetical protein
MIRLCPAIASALLLASCITAPKETALDEAAVTARSAPLADRYQAELLAVLQGAMARSGAVGAIDVCHTQAPTIAARLSADSGARVSRTALRVRNPAAAPDAETRARLETLASAPLDAEGQPRTLVWASGKGSGARVQWLRAIPMKPPCATCHGTNVAPAVKTAIAAKYPVDAATGFADGALRGAFLISWPAEAFAPAG